MIHDRDLPLDAELIELGSDPDSVMQEYLRTILAESRMDVPRLVDEIAQFERRRGTAVYSELIYALSNLRFSPEDSKSLWGRVVSHHAEMEEKLGDLVDIRVALVSHLLEHNRTLHDPKVIGLHLFQSERPQAHRDDLTGLFGPAMFRESLGHELYHAERTGKPLSVALVNVDGLKQINEQSSFETGNHIIRELAQILNRELRRSDIACRSGVEDFGLILPHTPKSSAHVVAERARLTIENHTFRADSESACRLTVSVGIATYPADADNVTELIRQADRALYMAKRAGKNQVALFGESRRSFGRVRATLPGSFRTLAESVRTMITVDISEGGVLFRTADQMPVGSLVQMHVEIAPEQRIEAVGRVVYVENGGDGTYRTGVDLIDLRNVDRVRLSQLIRESTSVGHPVEASPE